MLRKFRNILGGLLGYVIIYLGYLKRKSEEVSSNNYIIPIYFHNPNRKLFEKTVKWFIRNDYEFISSEKLIEILENKSLPSAKTVWLTFDDGFKDNLENVIHVLNKYDIPATIFITTGAIEQGYFWWTVAKKYEKKLPVKFEGLLEISEKERRSIINDLVTTADEEIERESMTINDIKILSKNPLITIGSHTDNHPIITNCSDEEFNSEIKTSLQKLESWTGTKITLFSFPNGDHIGDESDILKSYNIKLAATTKNDFIKLTNDILFLPRLSLMDDGFFSENLCHMMGIWNPVISNLKKRLTFLSNR